MSQDITPSTPPVNNRTCCKCGERVKEGEYYHVNRGTTTGPVDVVCSRCAVAFAKVETWKRPMRKIGRNEPCHCCSGKKYKKCCGK